MENNFEKWRSCTRYVASVEILLIIFQTLVFLPIAYSWFIAPMVQRKLLQDAITYSVIMLTVIVTEFCSTIVLIKASNKDDNVSTGKKICWAGIWYYFNMSLLIIGIIIVSYAFQPRPDWAFLFGVVVFIRTFMLLTVKMYVNDLCKRVPEETSCEV